MIESGFLGIPRHLPEEFDGDGYLMAVYLKLCFMANFRPGKKLLKQGITLEVGQLCTSLAAISKSLGFGIQVVRRCLDALEKHEKINRASNTHGTIITIRDYATLFLPVEDDQHTNQHAPNTRPTRAQQHQNKGQEDKKTKRKQKTEDSTVEPAAEAAPEPTALLLSDYTPTHYLAERWAKLAKAQAPWLTPDLDNYVAGIHKLQRAINLTDEGVERLLAFVEGDGFWKRQALSPGSLFKKSERNGLRKIDNLLLSFKKTCDPEDRVVDAVQNVMAGNYRDPFNDANYK